MSIEKNRRRESLEIAMAAMVMCASIFNESKLNVIRRIFVGGRLALINIDELLLENVTLLLNSSVQIHKIKEVSALKVVHLFNQMLLVHFAFPPRLANTGTKIPLQSMIWLPYIICYCTVLLKLIHYSC